MSKKLVQEYLKKGDNISTNVIFDDGKKFELNIKGDVKIMSDSGFSKKQLEQLQGLLNPIAQRLDKIEYRLDILESFHRDDFKKLKTQKKK